MKFTPRHRGFFSTHENQAPPFHLQLPLDSRLSDPSNALKGLDLLDGTGD